LLQLDSSGGFIRIAEMRKAFLWEPRRKRLNRLLLPKIDPVPKMTFRE
jgi:hypothetical protein